MQCLSKLNYLILSMIDVHVGVWYPSVEVLCHLDVFPAETSQILLYPHKGFVSSLKKRNNLFKQCHDVWSRNILFMISLITNFNTYTFVMIQNECLLHTNLRWTIHLVSLLNYHFGHRRRLTMINIFLSTFPF